MSPPFAVSGRAVIFDTERHVLLIRRSDASRHWPGQWEVPGGKDNPGESLDEALRREVREETGLEVRVGEALGDTEHEFPEFRVVYRFFATEIVSGTFQLSEEHTASAWVAWAELPRYGLIPPVEKFFKTLRLAGGN